MATTGAYRSAHGQFNCRALLVQESSDEETGTVTAIGDWAVAGPYFEACSCEAICPCRSIGGRKGGRSTYGVCDFALGWTVEEGHADGVELSGLKVVMAGSYDDDEPGSPWRVALYVDERGTDTQRDALATIFLGRAGGTALTNFARHIEEVWSVRSARITIDHTAPNRRIRADEHMNVEIRGRCGYAATYVYRSDD